jgi:hypothetical protein
MHQGVQRKTHIASGTHKKGAIIYLRSAVNKCYNSDVTGPCQKRNGAIVLFIPFLRSFIFLSSVSAFNFIVWKRCCRYKHKICIHNHFLSQWRYRGDKRDHIRARSSPLFSAISFESKTLIELQNFFLREPVLGEF